MVIEKRDGEAGEIESDERTRKEIAGWYLRSHEYGKNGRY
jgi:hypothetical protein